MRLRGGEVERIADAVVSVLPSTRSLATFTLVDLGIASKDALSVSIVLLILTGIILLGIPYIAFAVAVILEHDYRVVHIGAVRPPSVVESVDAALGGATPTAPGAGGAGIEMDAMDATPTAPGAGGGGIEMENPLRRVGASADGGCVDSRSAAAAAPGGEPPQAALAPPTVSLAVANTVVVAAELVEESALNTVTVDAPAADAGAAHDSSDDFSIDLGEG